MSDGPGRPEVLDKESVRRAVRSGRAPYATAQHIADRTDSSKRTVQRNLDEETIEDYGLATGKVDRATVYWVENNSKDQNENKIWDITNHPQIGEVVGRLTGKMERDSLDWVLRRRIFIGQLIAVALLAIFGSWLGSPAMLNTPWYLELLTLGLVGIPVVYYLGPRLGRFLHKRFSKPPRFENNAQPGRDSES